MDKEVKLLLVIMSSFVYRDCRPKIAMPQPELCHTTLIIFLPHGEHMLRLSNRKLTISSIYVLILYIPLNKNCSALTSYHELN